MKKNEPDFLTRARKQNHDRKVADQREKLTAIYQQSKLKDVKMTYSNEARAARKTLAAFGITENSEVTLAVIEAIEEAQVCGARQDAS